MKEHKLGIIMNGVTGRMGTNQHLIRSICAIRDQRGIQVSPDVVITVDPVEMRISYKHSPKERESNALPPTWTRH